MKTLNALFPVIMLGLIASEVAISIIDGYYGIGMGYWRLLIPLWMTGFLLQWKDNQKLALLLKDAMGLVDQAIGVANTARQMLKLKGEGLEEENH